MYSDKTITPDRLEQLDFGFSLFACTAIGVLAIGTAVFMYSAVFLQTFAPDTTLRVEFSGFCTLSLLLTVYLWDRQLMIRRLRRQMEESHRRSSELEIRANQDLLKSMPKLRAFQDTLPMEFRRTVATTNKLSIALVTLNVPATTTASSVAVSQLSGAAKVMAQTLRGQDSMYILGPTCLGVVLPGADLTVAKELSARATKLLSNCQIEIVNYPAHASSAHELQQRICDRIPEDDSVQSSSPKPSLCL